MKGVILAGGLGTRLYPLTKVTNKHLLPIYNKPMIFYPIQTMVEAGVKEIMLVTGGNDAGDFLKLLGNGREFGITNLAYAYQEGNLGIANALSLAEHFAAGEKIFVLLGDNIFSCCLKNAVEKFLKQPKGAMILLKEVDMPQRFGVPVFKDNKIVRIEEKPEKPKSSYAVTGAYFYDSKVFKFIKELKPSERGEYEITDINNRYLELNELDYQVITDGWWTDAGTFDSLLKANILVAQKNNKNLLPELLKLS